MTVSALTETPPVVTLRVLLQQRQWFAVELVVSRTPFHQCGEEEAHLHQLRRDAQAGTRATGTHEASWP